MEERVLLKARLMQNHLTNSWLVAQLAKRGIEVSGTHLSKFITGARTGDTAESVIRESLAILDEYEKKNV